MTRHTPQDVLRLLLKYDPANGRLSWRMRAPDMFDGAEGQRAVKCATWNRRCAGKHADTCLTEKGYRIVCVNNKRQRAHRVVWAMLYGEWPSQQIDHINHDPADNRACNLRLVTNAENGKNRPSARGIFGVRRNPKSGLPWIAGIKVDGLERHLGTFATFEEAVAARKRAERQFGFHPNHGKTPDPQAARGL